MIVVLFTPGGVVEIDPETVSDEELAELGLTRAWADEQVARGLANHRMNELTDLLKQGAHVVISMPTGEERRVVNLVKTVEGKLKVNHEV